MTRQLFVVASLALLAGCQRPATSPTPPTSGRSGTTEIVYIPKNTGNPYFSEVVRGFEEQAKEAGIGFTTTAPSTAAATSQIPFIKEQIQRKVAAIALTPNSPDALNPVLDEARQAGIAVLTVDADLVGNESHRAVAILPTDFSKIGESQVELLGSQIGYAGEIAILSATRDAPNQNAWIEGMKKALQQPKYAKMTLVEIVYGDDEPEKSATETRGLLSKHPDLRGIIAPTSVGLASAAQVLMIAGKYPGGPRAHGPGIALTGLSTPNQMKRYVQDGVVQAFQLWSPRDMGRIACDLAARLARGEGAPTPGTELDFGALGKRTVQPNGVIFAGPLVTFDKTNVGQFDF